MSKQKKDHIVDVNKKVTAINWLIDKIYFSPNVKVSRELLDQANEIFEQQIIDAHTKGYLIGGGNGELYDCKQYYKKTFNK